MRTVRLDIGELPQPGKFYVCKNHPLNLYKSIEAITVGEDEDDDNSEGPEPCGEIPKGSMFMYAGSAHEQRIPGQIKKVWFHVLHGEMTGVVYNGQIPFHQFLSRVVEE
jgi:hypothetical protein